MMSRVRLFCVVGALSVAAIAMPGSARADGPADMATRPTIARSGAFMKMDGPIQGASTDKIHGGWIDISSFEMQSTSAASQATGSGAGRAAFNSFQITKVVDKSSPSLYQASSNGTHFKTVVIEMTKPAADGRAVVYYKVTLTDVMISKVQANGSAGGTPTESLTFAFQKFMAETAPKNTDGTPGTYSPVQAGWDIKANTKI
jgi:type VI secretion system Hcp family effector